MTADRAEMPEIRRRATALAAHDSWPRPRLLAYQQERLGETLAHAVAHSPYYRETIGHLVAARAPLSAFPVLTKAELMRNFDRIVTDSRLTLRAVEAHLAGPDPGALVQGQYRLAATGGTTGLRAIMVYDQETWQAGMASSLRWLDRQGEGPPPRVAGIGAASPVHLSGRIYEALRAERGGAPRLTLTMPVAELVRELNAFRPDAILTYPSCIRLLAQEQQAGRLAIAPKAMVSVAEGLAPEVRDLAREAWGIAITNRYNTTETFASASECHHHCGIHLPEDLVVYEPVDAGNHAVPDGTLSSKLLVTTLANRVMPLIRYEMTDMVKVTTTACACGRSYARMTEIAGRKEEVLAFEGANGEVRIHAGQLRSPLVAMAGVVQFQFARRGSGLELMVAVRDADRSGEIASQAKRAVAAVLASHGVDGECLSVRTVPSIARSGNGEKARLVAA